MISSFLCQIGSQTVKIDSNTQTGNRTKKITYKNRKNENNTLEKRNISRDIRNNLI